IASVRIRRSQQAAAAQRHIIAAHAAVSEESARRIAERFRAGERLLAKFPYLGRLGRQHGTRELMLAGTPYLIIYRVTEDYVELLEVLHSSRRR
ncbi:MAG TPA: type II toxin-antitoxin system RelE/ParE family toxin, partial [Chloroflexota bacterium]|nr:type II toxin-antitoxin system RelE/ParE family toxin [Chloroflexota bacterium]